MALSAFGVEHPISKSDALGSPESIMGMEHDRGEHAGKMFRRCPGCSKGTTSTVTSAVKALTKTKAL